MGTKALGHKWQKGQSGNPSGKPLDAKAIYETMRLVSKEPVSNTDKRIKLRALADALFSKAIDGDVAAAREIMDRLGGKPVQQQVLSGDPDAPLNIVSDKPLDPEEWAVQYGFAANQD